MSRSPARPAAQLWHREDPSCPQGPKLMMSDVHRIGCANGRQCVDAKTHGGAKRATVYVRLHRPPPRAFYVCTACARVLAHRHDVALMVPVGESINPRPTVDARQRLREAHRG